MEWHLSSADHDLIDPHVLSTASCLDMSPPSLKKYTQTQIFSPEKNLQRNERTKTPKKDMV
jgi:hypothetical protein